MKKVQKPAVRKFEREKTPPNLFVVLSRALLSALTLGILYTVLHLHFHLF